MDTETVEKLRKFLANPDVQKAIDKDDWDYVFAKWFDFFLKNIWKASLDLPTEGFGSLPKLLRTAGVDFLSKLDTIPANCFEDDDKLKTYTIPENIKIIQGYAFKNCKNLEEVHMSKNININSVGSKIFTGCDKLKNIYFDGTINEFNARVQNQILDKDSKATITCKDGIINNL